MIVYDSMLSDTTKAERMDHVSSQGYAWGYIGSCIPFIISLVIVLGSDIIGISMETAMTIAFIITAVWWIGMTLPMLKTYRQKYYVEKRPHAIKESFIRLGRTLKNVRKEKKIFLFLLALICHLHYHFLELIYILLLMIAVCMDLLFLL